MLDLFTIRSDFDDKAELIYDYLNEVIAKCYDGSVVYFMFIIPQVSVKSCCCIYKCVFFIDNHNFLTYHVNVI
ncbi:Uncharacterised protein [Enterobacter hormaechei]|nr:Uncharacterised protein [Enterobacter hormaechei]